MGQGALRRREREQTPGRYTYHFGSDIRPGGATVPDYSGLLRSEAVLVE